nr:RNA-directed DNA polymerase, eukaryota [Tanacetum cinerariifolium]
MSKSKIMGLYVDDTIVHQAASKLGCLVLNCPFLYLGTKVGGAMSRVQAWKEIVDKVKSRFSKVPLKVLQVLESIRGQFFNGHDMGSNKATWVKWNSVLTDINHGGLGVSSLYALNRGLMLKWVCKFLTQKESLWTKVIIAIHGVNGGIEEEQLNILSEIVRSINLVPMYDRWVWSLENSGEFTVASTRKLIDEIPMKAFVFDNVISSSFYWGASCGLFVGLDPLNFLVGGSSFSLGSSLGWRLVCLPRVYNDVGCLLALVLFHALPLSISLMHTYTGRRSPGSSLFTFGFILEVGVGSVYISPPSYLALAGLGMLLLLLYRL